MIKGKVNILLDVLYGSSAKGQSCAFLAKIHRPEILISTNRANACLVEGNLVFTNGGIVPIELIGTKKFVDFNHVIDYSSSTEAYDMDGNMQPISKTYDVGARETLKVTLKNGQEIECTPNHQFYLWDGESLSKKWVSAEDLDPSKHQFLLKRNFDELCPNYKSVPLVFSSNSNANNGNKSFVTIDENMGYLFGLLCGDGSYSSISASKGRVTIAFADNNLSSFEKATSTLNENGFEWNTSRNGDTASFSLNINSVAFKEFLVHAGFELATADKKSIPTSIFKSPKSVISAFIAGLIESDGSVSTTNGGRITVLSNISKKMCSQTQVLLQYLGINSKMYSENPLLVAKRNKKTGVNRKVCYKVEVSSAEAFAIAKATIPLTDKMDKLSELVANKSINEHTFNCYIKNNHTEYNMRDTKVKEKIPELYEDVKGYFFVDIISVEYNGVKNVYDITVDNTHSYYCNGWISHNSHTHIWDENSEEFVFKILPTAAGNCKYDSTYKPYIFIGPTAGFEVDQLIKEIKWCGLSAGQVIIHPRAMIINQNHKDVEAGGAGTLHLGSTMSGAGACYAEKVMRGKETKLAGDFAKELEDYCIVYKDSQAFEFTKHLSAMLDSGLTALGELSQGFPLSLDHGQLYNYATSRNVVPAQMLSDLGLRPDYQGVVYANIRSFPIRVSNRFDLDRVKFVAEPLDGHGKFEIMATTLGMTYNDVNPIVQRLAIDKTPTPVRITHDGVEFNLIKIVDGINGWSGPCESDMQEISWKELAEIAGINDENYHEKTTLTKLTRRIFKITDGSLSKEILKKFKVSCSKDPIFIVTFVNYVNYSDDGITSADQISHKSMEWIRQANNDIKSVFGENFQISYAQFGKYISNQFPVKA